MTTEKRRGANKKAEASRPEEDKEIIDYFNANRLVWLLKLPKYIVSRWEQMPEHETCGTLTVNVTPGEKDAMALTLTERVAKLDPVHPLPTEHLFDWCEPEQMMGVVSHVMPPDPDAEKIEKAAKPLKVVKPPKPTKAAKGSKAQKSVAAATFPPPKVQQQQQLQQQQPRPVMLKQTPHHNTICLEGRVVKKLNCRPVPSTCYMNMKMSVMRRMGEPQRKVQILDHVVLNYKPVSDHKIEYKGRKKANPKRGQMDKDAVLNMLFNAFEKHQYYRLGDLVQITNQPYAYLKTLLKEICIYNTKSPHKYTWHLKPEYCHYDNVDTPAATPIATASYNRISFDG